MSLIDLRILAFSCADLAQSRCVVFASRVQFFHVLHQVKMRLERFVALRAAVNTVASDDTLVSAFHVHLKVQKIRESGDNLSQKILRQAQIGFGTLWRKLRKRQTPLARGFSCDWRGIAVRSTACCTLDTGTMMAHR